MVVRSASLSKPRLVAQPQEEIKESSNNSINTNLVRNNKINIIGPAIGGAFFASLLGGGMALLLARRSKYNFCKKHNLIGQKDYDKLSADLKAQMRKQLKKIWGISLSTAAAIGATIYGTAAWYARPNQQAYNFSKEEFANSRISPFRLVTGQLRDDEIYNINKYRILPKNAMLVPVGVAGIYYSIGHDKSESNQRNKNMPKGFVVKKSLTGVCALYPKGYKNWLLK